MEFGIEMDHIVVNCRTPPLPRRNPKRQFSQHEKPLPPLPDGVFQFDPDLIPRPLFSDRITLRPQPLRVTTMEFLSPTSSPAMSPSTILSRATSLRSSNGSVSSSHISTPATSPPSSPNSRPRSLTYSSPPPTWLAPLVAPEPMPRQSLRRKKSPRKETLRSIRAKESDACLQRVYDQRLSGYLDDSMLRGRTPVSGLRMFMEN